MNNVNAPTLFNTMAELVNSANGHIKWASDGFNSSMPENPEDNLTEYSEGAFSSEMERDLKKSELANVNSTPDLKYSTDHQIDNLTSNIPASESDKGDHDYNFGHPDPGTSLPADTENEKFASYSFETNYAAFRKLASAFVSQPTADYEPSSRTYPTVQKQASYDAGPTALDYDRMRKLAALIEGVDDDARTFAKMSSYSQYKMASGEEITPEDAEAALANEAPVSDPAAAMEEAALLEAAEDPEVAAALEEVIAAIESGEVTPEEVEAAIAADEAAAAEEDVAIEEAIKEAAFKKLNYYDTWEKQASYYLNQIPTTDAYNIANLPLTKLAELMEDIAAEEAAGDDIDIEDAAAIENLSDEELEALVELAEAVESGEIDPSAIDELGSEVPDAALAAGPEPIDASGGEDLEPTDDEALGELSAAMMEQGVTPEDLESDDVPEEKQASLRKLASFVRNYRNSGKFQYSRTKTKKQAEARRLCHQFLNEFLG